MEHLPCDGVEQHPRGPGDLLLRQGRHLGILLLRIPSNTLLARHIQTNEGGHVRGAGNSLPSRPPSAAAAGRGRGAGGAGGRCRRRAR
jgi:hypothetical protein